MVAYALSVDHRDCALPTGIVCIVRPQRADPSHESREAQAHATPQKSNGPNPPKDLTPDSTEAEVDAYLKNREFYPVGNASYTMNLDQTTFVTPTAKISQDDRWRGRRAKRLIHSMCRVTEIVPT